MIQPVFAIDPGNTESAYVVYEPAAHKVQSKGKVENEELVRIVSNANLHGFQVAIEMIACYGMPVGKEVFETCLFIGRLIQLCKDRGCEPVLVLRKSVKMHLCNSVRAKDGNVRQALIDKFEPTGGGKNPVVGIKSKPGPLYGFANDTWAALGVALTFAAGAY